MAATDERRRAWTLPVAVFVLVACVTAVASTIWWTYYSHHPLWVEHAAYGLLANIEFNELLDRQSYVSAIVSAFGRMRFLLQPALLGLSGRGLLLSPLSHLLVNALALSVYLSLLVHFVHQRTGSRSLAIAAAVMSCSLGGLYSEVGGLGVPWPDYQSMFLLSSAVLCLGLYAIDRRLRWLMWTGVCITLVAMARDTGAAYAAVICVPILVLLLLTDIRRVGWRGVAIRAAACAIPALPAIVLLLAKLTFFQQYYMTANAIQLRQPIRVALQSIWQLFSTYTGLLPLACLAAIIVIRPLLRSRWQWSMSDVVMVWWPLSFLGFLLINGYTSDVTKEVMYIAPGLICAVFTVGGGIEMRSWPARVIVFAMVIVCVIGAGRSALRTYDRASHPSENAVQLRTDQHALAKALASFPQHVTWQSYSMYDWGTVVSALTAYEFGHYQPADNRWFHNRRNYWDANFPGMALPALEAHLFEQANMHVDMAIVLANPKDKPSGMEDYSFSIAASMAERVQHDPAWTHYRDVNDTLAGSLSLYLNTQRLDVRRRVE